MLCQIGFTVKLAKIEIRENGTAAGRNPLTGDNMMPVAFFSEPAQLPFT